MLSAALVSFILAALSMNASDAASVLESAQAKQAERWSTVENYTVTLSVKDSGGLETPIFYEKMEVDGQVTFRMVPPPEYYTDVSTQAGFPPMSDEGIEQMAEGLDMLGDAMAVGGGDQPAMDVRGMTGQMSAFARASATARSKLGDGKAEATDAVNDFGEFMQRARLSGTEPVLATSGESGQMKDAYLLVADDLSDIELDQPEGNATFTLKTVSLWIETEQMVPLRLLMEGEVKSDGKKMPMSIEKLDLDYKQVGPLYESHHQVYRLSGLMSNLSEKDRKDLEKAKKEMEKAKKQLEEMPAEQRAMVEKMMKSQMEKFEAMASGDAITSITEVVSIAINEGPPTPYGPGRLTVGGPAASEYPGALTVAANDLDAELAIAARVEPGSEAIIGLMGVAPFPAAGGQIEISGASGHVRIEGGADIGIEGGTGTITVTERTETRIVGTFTALLTGTNNAGSGDGTVQFSASGTFDTGAPVGPFKALRGSPIPADLFNSQ